jgi:DnaK suppressor protein
MATKTTSSKAAPPAAASSSKSPARSKRAHGALNGVAMQSLEKRMTPITTDTTNAHSTADNGVQNAAEPNKTVKPKAARQSAAAKAKNGEAVQQRNELDIEYFRGLLISERVRLEEERDALRKSNVDMDGALPEEGEGGDEDTADLASAMMDKEYELSVEDEIDSMLESVDHALRKMDDGTYGVCDMSGKPIPARRLELIPWASLTVECQALAEGE